MQRFVGGCFLLVLIQLAGCGQESEYNGDNRTPALSSSQQPIDEDATMEGAVAAGCGSDLFVQDLVSDPIVNKGRVPIVGDYTIGAESVIALEREKIGLSIGTDFKLTSVSPRDCPQRSQEDTRQVKW
jgi:hypothetical protein